MPVIVECIDVLIPFIIENVPSEIVFVAGAIKTTLIN